MDVCKTAPTATEIPLDDSESFLPPIGEEHQRQQLIFHDAAAAPRVSSMSPCHDAVPAVDDGMSTEALPEGGDLSENEEKWSPPTTGCYYPTDVLLPAKVADMLTGDDEPISRSRAPQGSLPEHSIGCQQEPLQFHETEPHIASDRLLASKKTDVTPVLTDDSLSSDEATGDTSQSSNPEYINKCQATSRRMSSASASSSTATISPSDTLAGASTTDESISSDETALDFSQNSFESTKYQSDLESVSVSSIVRKSALCTTGESIEDMSRRRVSFPMKDSDLITGYMEPANPWESAISVTTPAELINLYKASCRKHNTTPLDCVALHLKNLNLRAHVRQDRLALKDTPLRPEACEALEEILKIVQYQTIDLTRCNLNDMAASAIFDMIEFYESAVEVNVSENPSISSAGWQSCISMIRKSRDLRTIILRGNPLSELHAANLGKAINISNLHTLKLEHCGLTGKPLASLCNTLKNNKTLRELWLAHNDLFCQDADNLAILLKTNPHLQLLDVSNNNLKDTGVKSIAIALIQQATNLMQDKLKAIEYKSVFPEIPKLFHESVNKKVDSSTKDNSGNESQPILNSLLEMQPPVECRESEQTVSVSANNNAFKKKIADTITKNNHIADGIVSCNERDLKSADARVELLDPISEKLTTGKDDIEMTVSYGGEIGSQHSDDGIGTNNNTLKHSTTNVSQSERTAKISKIVDMNENKGCADSDSVLISIIDEPQLSRSRNNSSSTMNISSRPSSVEEFQRQHKSEEATNTTRSQSCDSLSSDNSFDAIETHLSAEIKEKITKNDTLGRQQKLNQNNENLVVNNLKAPRGLQALILWNNNLTRSCGECIADMIASTNSLEILNIGKNTLSNEFIQKISNSLKYNRTLTNLGLQSSHLSSKGIEMLAQILQFGGNSTLERIDIRDNNIQVDGLAAICEALKSNKSITQIDIDDEPKRHLDDGDGQFHYSKYLQTIRSLITKNQSIYEIPKIRNSRKISLTCQSIHAPVINTNLRYDTLDVKKKSGAKLRSPLPSPPTGSPSSSPVPSPSRSSRFHVSRVFENGKDTTTVSSPRLENKSSEPVRSSPSPTSRFRVIKVEDDKDFAIKKECVEDSRSSSNVTNRKKSNDILESDTVDTADIQFVFPDVSRPKVVENSRTQLIEKYKAFVEQKLPVLLVEKPKEVPTEGTKHCKATVDSVELQFPEKLGQPLIDMPINPSSDGPRVKDTDKTDHQMAADFIAGKDKKIMIENGAQPIAVFPNSSVSIPGDMECNISESMLPGADFDSSSEGSSSDPQKERIAKQLETKSRVAWNHAAVDKIKTFFNNSQFFARASSSEADKKSSESFDSLCNLDAPARNNSTAMVHRGPTSTSKPIDSNPNISRTQSILDAATRQLKGFKQVLTQNMTTVQQSLPAPSSQSPITNTTLEESPSQTNASDSSSMHTLQESHESNSPCVNLEIKENISPEQQHSLTTTTTTPSCVQSNEVANANKILKLENNGQVAVDLGEKITSELSIVTQSQAIQSVSVSLPSPLATTQGNDKHEI